MKFRRNLRRGAGAIIFLLITGLLLQSVIFQRSINYLLQRARLDEYVHVPIRYIGMFGAGVGPVVVGGTTGEALTISTADINYSPATLLQKKITSLSMTGITIPLVLEPADGTVVVPFLPAKQQTDNKATITNFYYWNLLNSIEQAAISGRLLLYIGKGNNVSIPFTAHFSGKGIKEVTGAVHVLGNDISVRAVHKKKGIDLTFSASGILLSSLHTVLDPYGIPNMQGVVEFGATLFMDCSTGALSNYHADIKVKKIAAAGSGAHIERGNLSLWHEKKEMKFKGNADLSLPAFETARLSWSGFYDKNGTLQVDTTGTMTAWAGPFFLNAEIPLRCQGRATGSGAWSGTCREEKMTTVQVSQQNKKGASGNSVGTAEITHIGLEAESGRQTTLTGSVDLSSLTLQYQEHLVNARNIHLSGVYGRNKKTRRMLEAKAAIQEVKAENNDFVFHGAVHAASQTVFADNGETRTQGKITIEHGDGLSKHAALQVRQLDADIPFSWPWSNEQNKTGTLRFNNMLMGSMKAGSMILHLSKKAHGFAVDGYYANNAFGGQHMDISGEVILDREQNPRAVVQYDMADSEIETERSPHPFTTQFSFQGIMGSSGTLLLENGQLKGGGEFRLQHGALHLKKSDVTISGIMTSMHIKDGARFISFPAQRIDFAKITAGKITAGPGSVTLQAEGNNRLFIEQGTVHWAGGIIHVAPFRINQPPDQMATVLYCDRLRVADMISLLGSAAVEGEGLVSGMLPVAYSRGRLSFKDGYLYSKPGLGGRIRLLQTGDIMQGIPGAGAEQVNFVLAALKDFSYDWVRFAINSNIEENTAAIKMEMYGRPATALPFSYNNGAVVHVEGASGMQYPIQFTMNFTLPLNALIESLHGVRQMTDRLRQAP